MPCGSAKDSNNSDKNGDNGHCAFEDLDHSILQHPFNLGSNNVKQILKCMQNASKEVKDLILNECNIVYECKICANLFRSLANFLYHKRCYCKKHLCEDMLLFDNFEEETPVVVVQPEPPPDKDPPKSSGESECLSSMKDCTVNLVKTDVQEKHVTLASTEEPKNLRNKGVKAKDQAEDDGKKAVKASKVESPMISRRTREKNSRNASKRALRESVDIEPPKKATKSSNRLNASAKSSDSVKSAKVSNKPEIESVEPASETSRPGKEEKSKSRKEGNNKSGKEESIKSGKEETVKAGKEETNKPEKEETNKPEKEETSKSEKEEASKCETEETCNSEKDETCKSKKEDTYTLGQEKTSIPEKEGTCKLGKEETGKPEKIDTCKLGKEETGQPEKEDTCKLGKEETGQPEKEDTCKLGKEETGQPDIEASKSEKETETVMLPSEEETEKLTSEIIDMAMDGESASDQTSNKDVPEEMECVKSVATTSSNLLKKIIITKPLAPDIKNSTVLGNIQKNMKVANKIGFTKITNAAGKSLQCFPKIIFKTIDGNPHAVFQTTEGGKSESITLKTKLDKSVASNKSENEKLIIVLKKPTATVDSKVKTVKTSKNQSEFHLTRRKRLMARNDCNVQDLRCLTCNTQFTSLKTLYFHMLQIHSKKRLYYPCPFCKTYFVQMYGVTRHLISIHNKTKEQINKLRDVIKKKSIWKKMDDANMTDEIPPTRIEDISLKEDPKPEIKDVASSSSVGAGNSTFKTVIKINKNMNLHQCSKCARVFGRKSSQVSHEKFCIMNAIKVETVDLVGSSPISPPPNVSFLSLSPKKAIAEPHFLKPIQSIQHSPLDIKINARPKRGAEKQMHKDFVNSQTLKWRSANRVDTHAKAAQSVKKGSTQNLEKKIMNIMNVENLLCSKCNKVFSSFSNLRRHVAIHVGWTRFKCKYCEYQAYNKSQCWAHVHKTHSVKDEDLEKSIINLGSSFGKKGGSVSQSSLGSKRASDVKVKQIPSKANGIPKVKISRKKVTNYSRLSSDKKAIPAVKKVNLDKKEENKKVKNQISDEKKEISYLKKDRSQHENKKELNEAKKEKNHNLDSKKVINEAKKERSLSVDSKKDSETKREKIHLSENRDVSDIKKDKIITLENKGDVKVLDVKREKTQSLGPVFKCCIPDYKKDISNYKSVTTNNPTTIILSKKFSAPTVQSFVTVSPESLSSTKTFPLRSSPRKIETKASEGTKLTTLVTRSTAYSKGSPFQVKMPIKPPSDEDAKKSASQCLEKSYAKKERLISEWFPKKDLNSNSVRRESAPLIIGLVPAANSGSKSPVISHEKSSP